MPLLHPPNRIKYQDDVVTRLKLCNSYQECILDTPYYHLVNNSPVYGEIRWQLENPTPVHTGAIVDRVGAGARIYLSKLICASDPSTGFVTHNENLRVKYTNCDFLDLRKVNLNSWTVPPKQDTYSVGWYWIITRAYLDLILALAQTAALDGNYAPLQAAALFDADNNPVSLKDRRPLVWGPRTPKFSSPSLAVAFTDSRDRAIVLSRVVPTEDWLWLHWGMAMMTYPYFREVMETVGRLPDEFTYEMLLTQLIVRWGHMAHSSRMHSSRRRAIYPILQSLVNWGLLSMNRFHCFVRVATTPSGSDLLQDWLLNAIQLARQIDSGSDAPEGYPEAFPFTLTSAGVNPIAKLVGVDTVMDTGNTPKPAALRRKPGSSRRKRRWAGPINGGSAHPPFIRPLKDGRWRVRVPIPGEPFFVRICDSLDEAERHRDEAFASVPPLINNSLFETLAAKYATPRDEVLHK